MNDRNAASASPDGVSFAVNPVDRTLIRSIVARAFRDASLKAALDFIDESEDDARQTLTMDITAVHANGHPINLAELLDADDVTFGHDLTGIQRHVDRRTGKLRKNFSPRTALSDQDRAAREREVAAHQKNMTDLLAASHQAGRAEFALEVAKRDEEAKAAAERRRKDARNARRRKARGTVKGSSHSPRAAKRSPANRKRR